MSDPTQPVTPNTNPASAEKSVTNFINELSAKLAGDGKPPFKVTDAMKAELQTFRNNLLPVADKLEFMEGEAKKDLIEKIAKELVQEVKVAGSEKDVVRTYNPEVLKAVYDEVANIKGITADKLTALKEAGKSHVDSLAQKNVNLAKGEEKLAELASDRKLLLNKIILPKGWSAGKQMVAENFSSKVSTLNKAGRGAGAGFGALILAKGVADGLHTDEETGKHDKLGMAVAETLLGSVGAAASLAVQFERGGKAIGA